MDYESQIERTNIDIERLKTVLKNLHEHNQFLKQQYEAYKEYLANVRQNCSSTLKSKDNKESIKKKGPVKFSHIKLQQDGVIIESEVPDERFKKFLFFLYNSKT